MKISHLGTFKYPRLSSNNSQKNIFVFLMRFGPYFGFRYIRLDALFTRGEYIVVLLLYP
jgi:hypothetical protein